MVLAAGLGTRLAPLTHEVPKPLVWLGDRPLIDDILARLAAQGFSRVVANTHHLAERFDAAWKVRQPLDVTLVHEPHILGTGGGLANAAGLLGKGDVLVWNADIAAELDVAKLLAAHDGSDAVATFVTGPIKPSRAGTLGLDASGGIVRVRAFDAGGEVASADYAGIAILRPSLRKRLPKDGCLVGDALIPALQNGERAATFSLATPFFDLGTPRLYLDANIAWLARRGLDSYLHPSAVIGPEVSLERCVVAADARVEGRGVLKDVVVWPAATALAPLESAVVTPNRVVNVEPGSDQSSG
ncbi:MAG: NDP-sugar synthase [Polyangiaceae bacterium]|nr:NDP-sugar synthase [Polyangiaceae bacterium]